MKKIILTLLFSILILSCERNDGYHSSSWGHYKATFVNQKNINVYVNIHTYPFASNYSMRPDDTLVFTESETKHDGFGSNFEITGELATDTIISGILEPKTYVIE